jgi:hypothetical protein
MQNVINESWAEGFDEATRAYEKIHGRGKKWMDRHIPIYIKQNLMIPWYITPGENGQNRLFVIRYPINERAKVHFAEWI